MEAPAATAIRRRLFTVGILLVMLNIAGWFIPLRNEAIYEQAGVNFPTYITLRPEQVFNAIHQDKTRDRKDYLVRLTDALNNGVTHYWEDDGIDKYNMRIPVYENYLLYAASHLYPRLFRKYEFMNYRKAIERGAGLCSQYSLIISQVLEERGIPAKIVAFDGHVVATAQADPLTDEWWLLDADYGVVTPHDIRAVERNPELAVASYVAKGYPWDKLIVARLVKKGFRVLDGAKAYSPATYWAEQAAYILIWLIPVALMMPLMRSLLAHSARARLERHRISAAASRAAPVRH